ncbi:hypothetical protein TCAL_14332 [Tigriopus californicus]|uniref:C2H2-type domain-containing protein n=1 Tax=Tigriopus californicus TaxID=6832 RepID=A0A553NBZ2_TIGCA|nr:hypothetical protein TCAL_14332 [Tigriopus californicus]
MDQGVELVQRLQSYIPSPKLLYFVMDDWLLVHRNSFDHFNEDGEPFISQVFLIQIKTGHYIHRCQGQKVDHGTTIDLQVLTAKLTYAFQGTKPCLGYSTREDDGVDDGDPLSSTTTLDFPFRRKTSRNCQFYFEVPTIKSENNEAGNERCSPCQAVCQEVHSSSKKTTYGQLDGSDFALQTDAQSIVVDILRIKPENELLDEKDGLVCQICSESFKCKKTFTCHQRRAHSWGRMRCKPCGEWSNYSQDISAHTLLFHKDKPEVHCPICDEMIDLKDNPAAFDIHFPTCSPKRGHKRLSKRRFQCQLCGEKYSCNRSLDAHVKRHQGIVKFQCEYCDFGANLKKSFDRHKRMHLQKMGLLTEPDHLRECKVCGKKLTNKEALYNHMRNVHREQKPVFQCNKCGKLLKNSSARTKHKVEVHGHVPKSKGSK